MDRATPFGLSPERWKIIQQLRLLDNILMQTVLDQFIPGVELILRIIMDKPELRVTELFVEKLLPNLSARNLRLDVLATDGDQKLCNIEVQRSDGGAQPKRPRYHSALMDVQFLKPGMDPEQLPETYVIFITENDVLAQGLPLYHIDRFVTETGALFRDQAHILYANAAYTGDGAFGRLMHDFRESDPDKMYYSILADRVRAVKSNQKGVMEMSKVMDELYQEGFGQGFGQGTASVLAQMMQFNHWSLDHAMRVANLPPEKKSLYEAQIQKLGSEPAPPL